MDPCYGQYEFAGGPPPTPHPYFGQFGASPPPSIPVMVNLSSTGGCGVILPHCILDSLYIAPVMVNSSSLGCSNVISLPVVVNICTNSRKLFDHNTTQQIHQVNRIHHGRRRRVKHWFCAYLAIPFSSIPVLCWNYSAGSYGLAAGRDGGGQGVNLRTWCYASY